MQRESNNEPVFLPFSFSLRSVRFFELSCSSLRSPWHKTPSTDALFALPSCVPFTVRKQRRGFPIVEHDSLRRILVWTEVRSFRACTGEQLLPSHDQRRSLPKSIHRFTITQFFWASVCYCYHIRVSLLSILYELKVSSWLLLDIDSRDKHIQMLCAVFLTSPLT